MSNSIARLEYFIGLDLGRRRDYSALVVLERAYIARNTRYVDHTTRWEQSLTVRYAQQFRVGTPYGEVAQETARIYRNLEQRGNTLLIFDQTGVGDAVEEMIRTNLRGARQEGIVITQEIKRDIYAAIEIALEKGELKISNHCLAAQQLKEELLSVEIRRSGSSYKYGAFEKDAHDDLVMALGLACWRERIGRGRDNPYLRLPGF
jgi:phage FluMu gp28-like protein